MSQDLMSLDSGAPGSVNLEKNSISSRLGLPRNLFSSIKNIQQKSKNGSQVLQE